MRRRERNGVRDCSVTKQFTAALVLLLIEDGKLSLDDKVTRFDNAPEAWKDITVRHLLTHTSGLKNYTGLSGFEATKKLNAQKFVAALGVQPLESNPAKHSNIATAATTLPVT